MPQAKEEVAPGFEHVPAADLPIIDVDGVEVNLIMGQAYGAAAPVTCHSPTIYAAMELPAGGAIEIESEADERALYLLDGDAEVDGFVLQPQHLAVLAPGYRPRAAEPRRRPADAVRRRADGRRAPRLVEFRLVAAATASTRPSARGRPASSRFRPTTRANSSRFRKCR